MISSGLGGLAHVMVEMTVPGQRRMALTPQSPITNQSDSKKRMSKSISTISSDNGQNEFTISDKPQPEGKIRNKIANFFDSRKSAVKSMIEQPENAASRRESYRLASSPNLNTLEDSSLREGMKNTLTPHTVIAPELAQQGNNNRQNIGELGDCDSMDSMDDYKIVNTRSRSKRKQQDRAVDNLSSSDRNIPSRIRNGSISSPLFKRFTRIGKSKSNKNLMRTDSTESEHLLRVLARSSPADNAENLPRGDSSVNIFITDADSDAFCGEASSLGDKRIGNGSNNIRGRTRRSLSLMENPFVDSIE